MFWIGVRQIGITASLEWDWYNGNRIILVTISGDLSFDAMFNMQSDITAKLDSVDHLVHIFVDVTHIGSVPMSVRKILASARRNLDHDNMGYLAVAGIRSPFIRFITHVIVSVTPARMIEAETVDDCLTQLAQQDPSIIIT